VEWDIVGWDIVGWDIVQGECCVAQLTDHLSGGLGDCGVGTGRLLCSPN